VPIDFMDFLHSKHMSGQSGNSTRNSPVLAADGSSCTSPDAIMTVGENITAEY